MRHRVAVPSLIQDGASTFEPNLEKPRYLTKQAKLIMENQDKLDSILRRMDEMERRNRADFLKLKSAVEAWKPDVEAKVTELRDSVGALQIKVDLLQAIPIGANQVDARAREEALEGMGRKDIIVSGSKAIKQFLRFWYNGLIQLLWILGKIGKNCKLDFWSPWLGVKPVLMEGNLSGT
ncbi:hypothetical protein E2562_033633 [Oryza meyeriana var. granulata]|uniref:Uncharacterized protein n=1 Tax=Oryza meyeriana var. granulata TaxID=110450 RepID=A0A6G1CBS4_9ORYZ|nr:hypothetical protein E2562_033633 [Oryza meyeriana var. granulata]